MRFIADAMLGKLAKWLRILGYDAEYYGGEDDDALVLMARGQGRSILTRDTRLAPKLGPEECLFVRDNDTMAQLAQVVSELGLAVEPGRMFTRCTVCNGELVPVPKDEVRGVVPEYTLSVRSEFLKCPGCGRVYWEGTHRRRIFERLRRVGGGPAHR